MTLDQLRIFATVAELQHVTRAAEQLKMTQSAVSSAISTLEARHQIVLFNRVARRIELTAEGAQFLLEARAVLAQARRAEMMLADISEVQRGSLSIFASQTIANFWLPRHLTAYLERYPNIHLSVEIGNTTKCAEAVDQCHVELGFIEGEIDLSSLAMNDVGEDRLVLVVGKRHPWAAEAPTLPRDLPETKWALREAGSGTRSSFEQALAHHGLTSDTFDIVLELPSNEALCTAVAASELATVVSEAVAAAGVAAGHLVQLPFSIGQRTFRLIRHRERRLSRAASAFVELTPAVAR